MRASLADESRDRSHVTAAVNTASNSAHCAGDTPPPTTADRKAIVAAGDGPIYIGSSDVTEYRVTIRSPFCGHVSLGNNFFYCFVEASLVVEALGNCTVCPPFNPALFVGITRYNALS